MVKLSLITTELLVIELLVLYGIPSFNMYLFVSGSLFLFWDLLVYIEDTWDVELHAVEVISNHSPQLVQTRVTCLGNLRDGMQGNMLDSIRFCLDVIKVIKLEDDDETNLLHLHNLPWHVKDAARCPAKETSQASGGTTSDHSSTYRLGFTIQEPSPLLPLLPLSQL